MICQECQGEFKSLAALHRHLKKHNLTQKEYYHSFYPRKDKYDGYLIEYKDYKSYHTNDFNSRTNFLKWASGNYSDPDVIDYCFNLLKKRKEDKSLRFIPSQAEFKSLISPTWLGYEKMMGRDIFIKKCEELGLLNRFISTNLSFKEGDMDIWIDTREQNQLSFGNIKTIEKKLTVGDYTVSSDFYCDVFVERKSLMDLAGTLSGGLERFKREITRAHEFGLYLIVVVESPYSDVVDYSPKNSFARKLTGSHILHEIRALMQEFNNIQFLFAENRKTSSNYIEKIFRMGELAKTTDLELLKDRGIL